MLGEIPLTSDMQMTPPLEQKEKKRIKKQRRKGKIYPFECRVPKIAMRDKKASLSDQCMIAT